MTGSVFVSHPEFMWEKSLRILISLVLEKVFFQSGKLEIQWEEQKQVFRIQYSAPRCTSLIHFVVELYNVN